MNVVDFIIIIILLLGACGGYKRGLINTAAELFCNLIGLFIAYKYYAVIANWLNTNYLAVNKVENFIRENLVLPKTVTNLNINNISLPELGGYINKLEMPFQIKTHLTEFLQNLGADALSELGNLESALHIYLASLLINIFSFLIIWLAIGILCSLIAIIWNKITDGNALGAIDKAGGLVGGILIRAIVLSVVLGLLYPLISIIPLSEPSLFTTILKPITESKLATFLSSFFPIFFNGLIVLWR